MVMSSAIRAPRFAMMLPGREADSNG